MSLAMAATDLYGAFLWADIDLEPEAWLDEWRRDGFLA